MSTHAPTQKRQHDDITPYVRGRGRQGSVAGVGLPLFMQAKSRASVAAATLQRKCACASAPGGNAACETCNSGKPLQAKLTIGASDDPLEQEADRVADQVLAAPRRGAAGSAPLHIQRYAGHATAETAVAPASVDHVLESSGRPLEPALRQDMEQHFAHDFSAVRVHTDATAEQSAHEVNAHAYTVGRDVVFGAGQFAPTTPAGRRLLAHELTHVVQQSDSGTASAGGASRQPAPVSQGGATLQRKAETPGECDPEKLSMLGPGFHQPEAAVQGLGLPERFVLRPASLADDFVLYCPHRSTRPLKKLVACSKAYWVGDAEASGKGAGKDEVWAQQEGESGLFWGYVKKPYLSAAPPTACQPADSVSVGPPPPTDTPAQKQQRSKAEQERRQKKAFDESAQGRYKHTVACSEAFLRSHVWPGNARARAMVYYATQAVSGQYGFAEEMAPHYFGNNWRRYRNDITVNLNLISQGIEKGGYDYECENDCDSDVYAYIWPLGRHTIHLCENTITQDKTAEAAAQTILHEMARSFAGADAPVGTGGDTYGCNNKVSEEAADSPACLSQFAVTIFGKK